MAQQVFVLLVSDELSRSSQDVTGKIHDNIAEFVIRVLHMHLNRTQI